MLGMALVRSLLICSSGLGGGGLAGHWLGVSRGAVHWLGMPRAGGPLARCVAGRRSTQARPRFGGVAKNLILMYMAVRNSTNTRAKLHSLKLINIQCTVSVK